MLELSLSEKCVFAMSSDDTVRLVRSGHDAVDILVHQVTPATVARVFSVRKYQSCFPTVAISYSKKYSLEA